MIKKGNILLCLSLCALGLVACNGNSGSAASVEPVVGEKGDKGDKGDTGVAGKDGKNGSSVLTGEGKPADSLGNDGDSYIDTKTFDFYTKANGAWTKTGSIKGADGANGFDGNTGAAGKNGTNGSSFLSGSGDPSDEDGANGDLYLNTSTYDIWKKTDGAWAKTGTNIKGATGDKGADATDYYANTFLPSDGGYISSDKGSYAKGETIKLTATAEKGYDLDAIEVTYDGTKSIYAEDTGLSDLLTNGIEAKENGYVFKPVFANLTSADLDSDISIASSGIFNLTASAYGTAENGIAMSASGKNVKIVGKTNSDGSPATTVYVSGKSTFNADYLTLENVNIVMAADYVDGSSILEFNDSYACIKNSTIAVSVETSVALNFKSGSFGIKDVTIASGADATSKSAFLTTAVLFGETEANAFSNVVVDGFDVTNVKKTSYGVYAGSIFKSYWDTKRFNFEIKNSIFGTSDTKIGEVWSHFRQKDYISDMTGSNKTLYKKYMKTASVKISSTNIYSDLTNTWDSDEYYAISPAIFTFRLMEDTSDTDTIYRRNFADILFTITSSKINDEGITKSNVRYGGDYTDNFPLVTLYEYYDDDDSTWYGTDRINYYNDIYPYATVDGEDAKLADGQYPSIN